MAAIPVSESGKEPEVCIIELGGTVGDIESMTFIEAFRQFQFRVRKENFCVAHVSLVPQVSLIVLSRDKQEKAKLYKNVFCYGFFCDSFFCKFFLMYN